MKLLLYADLHYQTPESVRKIKPDCDAIITLGDISADILAFVRATHPQPMYAVLGNHDAWDTVETANAIVKRQYSFYSYAQKTIIPLHAKSAQIGNVGIAGMPGSFAYRPGVPGWTQEQSTSLDIPDADILFSHDTGFGFMGRKDPTHQGLQGITKYIAEHRPKYNIFGHYHENVHFTPQIGREDCITECICIYGIALFETETGEIDILLEPGD